MIHSICVVNDFSSIRKTKKILEETQKFSKDIDVSIRNVRYFNTEQEAKDYLTKRAEMYFENENDLQEAINDINLYGSLSMDAVTGGIYEIDEEEEN